ncbi:hypothetical protein ARMGADRAFT_1034415 [Armillaria gallica]|uniref:Uncharacterized protein n=1 Tax=Armillaria gallica TaxID=47427 RepID=A0A2H3DK21_ARMGA|nr:hypothetical protein ARMGADRAFT_1034415 [Armillaria gallica]
MTQHREEQIDMIRRVHGIELPAMALFKLDIQRLQKRNGDTYSKISPREDRTSQVRDARGEKGRTVRMFAISRGGAEEIPKMDDEGWVGWWATVANFQRTMEQVARVQRREINDILEPRMLPAPSTIYHKLGPFAARGLITVVPTTISSTPTVWVVITDLTSTLSAARYDPDYASYSSANMIGAQGVGFRGD